MIREFVRQQYERFPYPPIPAFALPQRGEGQRLRYELGTQLAFGSERSHEGARILVAGAGTFEALVVAQAHPRAREITAVDVSEASIARLKIRSRLARVTRFPARLPRVRGVAADLHEWEPTEKYDYILASNVLHHVEDPAALFSRLAGWLKPDGILRVVTYPKASRLWMRETSRWLKLNGLHPATPGLSTRARELIRALPLNHPVRSCWESQPEIRTRTGLIDAFLHACENPLSPLEWSAAARAAGLSLVADTQVESSRSDFLALLLPATRELDRWEKLEILDDLLELCANPVLWFKRGVAATPAVPAIPPREAATLPAEAKVATAFSVPSRIVWELSQGVRRAEALLSRAGVSLEDALTRLRTEVGPRVSVNDSPLPGLSILDYTIGEVLGAVPPPSKAAWDTHQARFGVPVRLQAVQAPTLKPTGKTLAEQADYLQIRVGPFEPSIQLRVVRAD